MIHSELSSPEERLHLDLDDAHVHMHVCGAFVFDPGPLRLEGGGIDIERIRALVEARLHRVPRMRQCLVETPLDGRPAWVDDRSFNLQYHVRHTHLPRPGDDRQLKRLCGRIASQQLDREKPLWELWVVEGLEGDRFAVIAKVHQSVTHGLWGIGLMEALLSAEPEKDFEAGPVWLPRPGPVPSELLRRALRQRLAVPVSRGLELLRAGPDGVEAWARRAWASVGETTAGSETILNRPVGPHRRLDWLTFDAARARQVAECAGTGIEAVVLATVAGALGRFFEQRGIPPADQRRLDFRVATPEHPGGFADDGDPGETLSWMVSKLPIAVQDPWLRLGQVGELLGSGMPVSYGAFAVVSDVLPGLYGAIARSQLGRRTSNLTVTTVHGPEHPRFLLGARLEAAYPFLPLVPDHALRVALYRYGGRLHWGFNCDWDLVPDLHDLVEATAACFEELCHAAAERGD